MEQIKEVLKKPLEDINLIVDTVEYKNKTLNIILDSDEVIDVNKIVKASKLISKVLDKYDFIKESYMLDVSSKEKGE